MTATSIPFPVPGCATWGTAPLAAPPGTRRTRRGRTTPVTAAGACGATAAGAITACPPPGRRRAGWARAGARTASRLRRTTRSCARRSAGACPSGSGHAPGRDLADRPSLRGEAARPGRECGRMTAELTTPPLCRNCHEPRKPRANQPGYKGANGWCEACYKRWLAGRPPTGRTAPAAEPLREDRQGQQHETRSEGARHREHVPRQPVVALPCRLPGHGHGPVVPGGHGGGPARPRRVRLVPVPRASAWTSLSPRGRRASGAAMTEDERAKERRRRMRRGEVAA